jgi:hypothetical protein
MQNFRIGLNGASPIRGSDCASADRPSFVNIGRRTNHFRTPSYMLQMRTVQRLAESKPLEVDMESTAAIYDRLNRSSLNYTKLSGDSSTARPAPEMSRFRPGCQLS